MIHQLTPQFILEKRTQNEQSGQFEAVVLFVDTSGFTELSAHLVAYGKAGAEVLAEILGAVFTPLVQSVYTHGGYIAGFAGDAFKAIFPGLTLAQHEAALAAATAICQHIINHPRHVTQFGDFDFAVRASIASGPVWWGIWSVPDAASYKQAQAYTFAGAAMDEAIRGEDYAQAGEIIMSTAVYEQLRHTHPLQGQALTGKATGSYRINVPASLNLSTPLPPETAIYNSDHGRFYADILLHQTTQGEFRHVTAVFINLQTLPHPQEDDTFMPIFFRLLAQYGGYLCRIGRIGALDAGGTLLLFWGAPTAHENDVQRTLNFVLDLQAETAVPLRAGITYQVVYAGFIGSPLREEYTCYGLSVNLAARLMAGAGWGQIWLDEEIAWRIDEKFHIDFVGDLPFKGFDQPQAVYALQGRESPSLDSFFRGQMVGRQAELAQLQAAVQPLLAHRLGGVVLIQGEAGIGKSRLVHTFLEQSDVLETAAVFLCQTDEILREPLNPFRYFLYHYFDQTPASEAVNKETFTQILEDLIAETEDPTLSEELDRTRSFLGALLNLHWPNSLYAQLAPELRQGNTFVALKSLILAESLRQPLILQLEDGQWLDDVSREFLRFFTRSAADAPWIILATQRYEAEVDQDPTPWFSPDLPQRVIDLDMLAAQDIAILATSLLQGHVSTELVDLLMTQTEGNPFFVEQMVLYLQEEDLLVSGRHGWRPRTAGTTTPTTVQAVLVARLDRLTQAVKRVVQTAAVLGREFNVQVLSLILRDDTAVIDKVKAAEQASIWSALTEIRYLFRHTLLRDAAYQMQLQTQLRSLHQAAAAAIETLHADALAPYYADLVYHYNQAALPQSERIYARLAGQQAAAHFANSQALAFFSRALVLTPADDLHQRYELLLAREQIYHLQGNRSAQAEDLKALAALAPFLDVAQQAAAVIRQARYAAIIGDYAQAITIIQGVITLAQSMGDLVLEADGEQHWGEALLEQGQYATAKRHLEKGLHLSQSAQATTIMGRCHYRLGMVALGQGNYAEAQNHGLSALTIFRQMQDRWQENQCLNLLGILANHQGQSIKARAYYEEALAIAHQIGYRLGEGTILHNLAIIIALYQRKYDLAQTYYKQALTIFHEIGDRAGEEHCLINLGLSFFRQGNYAEAQKYYYQALQIVQEIGARRGEGVIYANLGSVAMQQGVYATAQDHYERALAIARELGARDGEGFTLNELGALFLAQGQNKAAITHYQHALAIRQALDQPQFLIEDQAGLAAAFLAQGDLDQARLYIEPVLAYLAENATLKGSEHPYRVLVNCIHVLQRLDPPQAHELLDWAYHLLQEQAADIDPAHRGSFLQNIPSHQEIIRLWQDNNR